MKLLKIFLAFVFILSVCVTAHAATNIYKDTYTVEDSTGDWTFSGDVTVNGVLIGKGDNATIISATPATLTTSTSGKTYIIDCGGRGATGASIVTVTLPAVTADNLVYTFISGDGSGVAIRPADSNRTSIYSDTLVYGLTGSVNNTYFLPQATVPATNCAVRIVKHGIGATGLSITVRSSYNTSASTGYWYVTPSNVATMTTILYERNLANPNYGN